MSDNDHAPPGDDARERLDRLPRLATEAPLARGAVVAALSGIVLGFCFLPQLLGLALAGLSIARGERAARRYAWLAIWVSLALTVFWAVVLGLFLKWWASTQVA
ncbi:hypothetical protein N865_05385 [Intrasporangium oryzae NRRL B-24470]|uniref:DUF4190 domain-containing protein n=1 Tax=Intrasporangium oryzae NRRL B-24470 TaxID=1386089 RepID=W9G5F8_9MICO|nr:hypothetical protein [Intrasporangium oryzae]EWT01270.1 hypothetical protein N865_05385 [Intrasporangium oryzae NRRL B-24470]